MQACRKDTVPEWSGLWQIIPALSDPFERRHPLSLHSVQEYKRNRPGSGLQSGPGTCRLLADLFADFGEKGRKKAENCH